MKIVRRSFLAAQSMRFCSSSSRLLVGTAARLAVDMANSSTGDGGEIFGTGGRANGRRSIQRVRGEELA